MNGNRLFAIALGAVLTASMMTLAIQKFTAPTHGEMEHVEVTVHKGDTPWGIAKQYCPEGVDIREYLTWVEDANGISFEEPIYPGMKILFWKEVED